MTGPPEGPDAQDPSEFFIVAPDAAQDRAPAGAPPRRPDGSGRRWAAIAIAALLAFALGAAVGAHFDDEPTGADASPPAPAMEPTMSTTAATPTTTMRSAITPSTGTRTSDRSIVTSVLASEPEMSSAAPWPTAQGACDAEVPLPILTGVRTLTGATGLQVLAGNDTRRFTIDSGRRSAPLFPLGQDEFVSQLAVDGAGVVAIISDCRGYPPVRVVRRSTDGTLSTIHANRPGYQEGSLITGGQRTWLTLYHTQPDSVSYPDSAVLLRATDGDPTTITLPDGFDPRAGSGDLIIGNWSDSESDVYGPIQVYDLSRRAIVAQLGGAAPDYVVDHGYIVWQDRHCLRACTVHRYQIASGATAAFTLDALPATSWVAISPDGIRVVGLRYDMTVPTPYATGHPLGLTKVVVLNLREQTVADLPGIELAPKSSPSLAFSSDNRWLLVGINNGRNGSVMIYDRELDHPFRAGVTVPGPVLWTIPIAVVG